MSAKGIVSFASLALLMAACGGSGGGGPVDAGPEAAADALGDDAVATGDLPNVDGEVSAAVEAPVLVVTSPSGLDWTTSSAGSVVVGGLAWGRVDAIAWKVSPSGRTGTIAVQGAAWASDPIELDPGDNVVAVEAVTAGGTARDAIRIVYMPGIPLSAAPRIRPSSVFAGEGTPVILTFDLGGLRSLLASNPRVVRVDADGAVAESLGVLVDNGMLADGDEIDGDGIYSFRWTPKDGTVGTTRLRVKIAPSGDGPDFLTPPVDLEVLGHLTPAVCTSHQGRLADARKAWNGALGGGAAAARAAAIAVLAADPDVAEVADAGGSGGVWVRWKDGVLGALNTAATGLRGGDADGDPPDAAVVADVPADAAVAVDVPVPDAAPDVSSPPDASGTDAILADVNGYGPLAPEPDPPGALDPVSTSLILERNVLLLSPFAGEFAPDDETHAVAGMAAKMACPASQINGPLDNAAADLKAFRGMNRHGVVAVATHADAYFQTLSDGARADMGWTYAGPHEVLWTGEAVDCWRLLQESKACMSSTQCPTGTECVITNSDYGGGTASVSGFCRDATQADLLRGRVVLGDARYGITPAFVADLALDRPFPRSLVHLGACSTMHSGSLATAFLGAGAGGVTGFSGPVTSVFANQAATSLLDAFVAGGKTLGAAFGSGPADPGHPGSFLRRLGDEGLHLMGTGLDNADFESGDLTGWQTEGDARVLSHLGETYAVSGARMGILSTGLGYTVTLGSMKRTLCVPPGTTALSFRWRFYSEEFREWCGSEYQDTFRARICVQGTESCSELRRSVDDLCDPGDNGCMTCGAASVGLVKSDVQFDQGDCWRTGWQETSLAIPAGWSGPLDLSFFCTDKGDSIYDTAILVDGLRLAP